MRGRGRLEEEARELIRDAIALHLEGLRGAGAPLDPLALVSRRVRGGSERRTAGRA